MAQKNWLLIGLIALAVYLLYTSGAFSGIFGGNNGGGVTIPDLPPSDKKVTITLNTKDALTEPALGANISYYVFTSGGAFYKEGSTTAGQVSFDVDSGTSTQERSWTLIAYDDDDSGNDYYPETMSFTTGTESMKTINLLLYKEGSAKISAVLDPVDNNANISTARSATEAFDIYWKVNETDTGYKNPNFYIEVNRSWAADIRCPDLTEVTCDAKLQAVSDLDMEMYCFRKEGLFTSEMASSATVVSCNVEFVSSDDAAATATIDVYAHDETMYKKDAYVTLGKDSFITAVIDPADNSNIGDTVKITKGQIMLQG